MENEFIALDVETANADYSSICQIGMAHFKDGKVIQKWSQLINPKTYFDMMNISIHGIDSDMVENSPTFNQFYDVLKEITQGKYIVHHMPFDRTAINRACLKEDLDILDATWLDTARVVRRTWEQFSRKGYGLSNVANFLNIEFNHHDALEDAITAGYVLLEAIKVNPDINDFMEIYHFSQSKFRLLNMEGASDGALYGETVVFTGALSLPRKEMAQLAAKLGCNVTKNVSKKTTLVVVGIQDASKLNGKTKSTKQLKAESLIETGIDIKIISEEDLIEMSKTDG